MVRRCCFPPPEARTSCKQRESRRKECAKNSRGTNRRSGPSMPINSTTRGAKTWRSRLKARSRRLTLFNQVLHVFGQSGRNAVHDVAGISILGEEEGELKVRVFQELNVSTIRASQLDRHKTDKYLFHKVTLLEKSLLLLPKSLQTNEVIAARGQLLSL